MDKSASQLGEVPILEKDIEIGAPLPWAAYDRQGNLLLREGFVVQSSAQRTKLVSRGLYRSGRPASGARQSGAPEQLRAEPVTVVDLVQGLLKRLGAACHQLEKGDPDGPERLLRLAGEVRSHCREHADGILGVLQMDEDGSYALLHPLHAGVLCAVMAEHLDLTPTQVTAVVAGALSHDIGMLAEHDALRRWRGPLPEDAWTRVRAHPAAGADLLRRAGVVDADWLDVVLHHHERLDGSGYPEGLQGDALSRPARLLAIADTYSAMIRPRPYRDAVLARLALRDIFLARGETIDPELAQSFIREMGVYPPGAVVRMASGEIGVVVRRSAGGSPAEVKCIIGRNGQPHSHPGRCGGGHPEHAITEMLPLARFRSLTRYAAELWAPLPEYS